MSNRPEEIFGEFKPRFFKMKKLVKSYPLLALSCLSIETLEKNCGALISSEENIVKAEIKAEVMGKFEPKFYKMKMEKAVEGPIGGDDSDATFTQASMPVPGPGGN